MTSASGSSPGGARNPIGRPRMNGSPVGWPGPVANCEAAKIAFTNVAFSTPTGVVAAARGVIPVAETLPFGAAA